MSGWGIAGIVGVIFIIAICFKLKVNPILIIFEIAGEFFGGFFDD
jgi:hypothetical protein